MRPATCVREGLSLDTGGMRIHLVLSEDVRLTPGSTSGEGVYMPTTLAHLWAAHRAMWATHVSQHPQLAAAGVVSVQEYHRLRPVRTWLRQLGRDHSRWELATTRLWNKSVVVALYLRWAHLQASLQEMAHEHLRRARLIYGFQSHRV